MNPSHVERVAVTGIGMVTSLGRDAATTFRRLVAGDIGIAKVPMELGLPTGDFPVAVVSSTDFDIPPSPDGLPQWSRCDLFAYQAAREAITQAGLGALPIELLVGESAGTLREAILDDSSVEQSDGLPFLRRMVHEPIGATGHRLRAALPEIATSAVVCSACSSGALAIALGVMRLEQGAVLPQLVGGTDALNALTLIGFGSLGALSTEPCRPFDAHRQGLNLGEGAAFLLLETEKMVCARAGSVLAWLDGYALGAEAHHLTHPEAEGRRASALMMDAMRRAGLLPCEVGYVNAHGTATLPNDAMEYQALARIFGDCNGRVCVSSAKGQLGHTLGAAGAIEAALVVQALSEQVVLPTGGLTEIAEDGPLTHVLGKGRAHTFGAALSTSFGFGGAGAVLALSSADRETNRPLLTLGERRLFVKTMITLGPLGILRGTENSDLVFADVQRPRGRLPFEPLELLVMERSRRFDRLTAMTALGTNEALSVAGIDGVNTGLVLGNAIGDVSRSLEFIKRVRGRGLRGAHPAEFPHLLPSSVSGNASIYSGLQGPVFNVSELGETTETAVALALTCLRSGVASAMIAGTVEALDEPVLSMLIASGRLPVEALSSTEGAAFLVIEAESASRSSEGDRCELVWQGLGRDWAQGRRSAFLPIGQSEVLWPGGDEAELAHYLTTLGWGDIARRTVHPHVAAGFHLSGFLYAAASARLLFGAADSILVVTEPPSGRHLALFLRR